jgi:hypothetical protein
MYVLVGGAPPAYSIRSEILCILSLKFVLKYSTFYLLINKNTEKNGPSLAIGCYYFECTLDWLFTNLSNTNK